MRPLPIIAGLAVWLAGAGCASALQFRLQGTTVFMSGKIELGDPGRFQQFLADRGHPRVTRVVLNSPGGWLVNATEIGRMIRRMNVTTVVDARSAVCASACTVIFAAGVQRHYLNADRLAEGVFHRRVTGLGFHEASNSRDNILMSGRSPGAGTGQLISAYHEFGVGRAGELAVKAPGNALFRINGRTALLFGIATSLSPP